MRAKRVCRAPLSGSDEATAEEADMVIDEEKADLEARTTQAVEELKSALSSQYVPSIKLISIYVTWLVHPLIA